MEKNEDRPLIIRQAQKADEQRIAEFYQRVIPSIDQELTSWIPGVYPSIKSALEAIGEGTFYLAAIGEYVAGTVILNHIFDEEYSLIQWQDPQLKTPEIMIIHTLVTDPAIRKKGIAQQLLDFTVELAKEQKVKVIRLDVLERNIPAKTLYEKKGFVYRGTTDLVAWDGEGADRCDFYERTI
ncbi:N-acetyltransferase [Enterococcus florum]|uniref:N-acetyltransferase n=1 Tax=Enterococcus florum TaxID=2480627 RepID=A0A4V0WPR8_9ENTE|nr:GNAT family N-acetyltransferase [Enterococcus florum]GCF94809.1 N-acetyltransferase [Enterococcus florum]